MVMYDISKFRSAAEKLMKPLHLHFPHFSSFGQNCSITHFTNKTKADMLN